MTIEMTIFERALESMVLAACESYVFGKDNGREAVETYAHLWGFRRLARTARSNMCMSTG